MTAKLEVWISQFMMSFTKPAKDERAGYVDEDQELSYDKLSSYIFGIRYHITNWDIKKGWGRDEILGDTCLMI